MGIEDLLSGRLSGTALAVLARAMRSSRVAALGANVLRRELGVDKLDACLDGTEAFDADGMPRAGRAPRGTAESAAHAASDALAGALAALPLPPSAPWLTTSRALVAAYQKGTLTPSQHLELLLAEAHALSRRQPYLRCIHVLDESNAVREAKESSERYARGSARSPLDGVPVVVKYQIAVAGFPRRLGHELPGPLPQYKDATLVARLRAAGAIIVGITPMTELGMNPIGVNPKRLPLRNPHHIECAAGGSSTGSGVAVSVGLVPLAVGADGGGSVRIPAAICGVFGLKPTAGRVSTHGDAFSGSLNQDGPIGASTLDLAYFLDAVASTPDPEDPLTRNAPKLTGSFAQALTRSVRGLRAGIDRQQLADADPQVVEACERAIEGLRARGMELVDVHIPLAEVAPSIGCVTIACEVQATMRHAFRRAPEAFGLDTQVLMILAEQLSATEYLTAQTLRARLRRQVAAVFASVDVLLLPTTQKTGLRITEAEEHTGRLDARGVIAMCRHTFLANLTGLPAGTAPVGLDREGLPIGLQIVGDAWDEATVLAVMAELERAELAKPVRPPYHVALSG